MEVTFSISFNVGGNKPLTDKEINDWKKTIRKDLVSKGWSNFMVEYQEDEDANKQ